MGIVLTLEIGCFNLDLIDRLGNTSFFLNIYINTDDLSHYYERYYL